MEPQPDTETVLEAAVGSYGLNEQGIQSRGQGQDLGWVLSYRRLQSNNDFPFTIRRLGKSGSRENSAVEYHNLQAKLTWQLAEDQVLTANALYLNKAFRVPGSVEFPSPDAEQNTNDLLLDLSWLWTQETGSLQARVFLDDLNYRFSAPQSQGSRDVILRNGWGSQLQYAWQAGENLEGVLGARLSLYLSPQYDFFFCQGFCQYQLRRYG